MEDEFITRKPIGHWFINSNPFINLQWKVQNSEQASGSGSGSTGSVMSLTWGQVSSQVSHKISPPFSIAKGEYAASITSSYHRQESPNLLWKALSSHRGLLGSLAIQLSCLSIAFRFQKAEPSPEVLPLMAPSLPHGGVAENNRLSSSKDPFLVVSNNSISTALNRFFYLLCYVNDTILDEI